MNTLNKKLKQAKGWLLSFIITITCSIPSFATDPVKVTFHFSEPAACPTALTYKGYSRNDWGLSNKDPEFEFRLEIEKGDTKVETTTFIGGFIWDIRAEYKSYYWERDSDRNLKLNEQTCFADHPTAFVDWTRDNNFNLLFRCPNNDAIANCEIPLPELRLKGDLNLDGKVDAADAGILFSAWGDEGEDLLGDLNNDGIVDVIDAGVMFGNMMVGTN